MKTLTAGPARSRISRLILVAFALTAVMSALLLPGPIWADTFITTVDTGANVLGDAGEASALALKSNGLAVISYWDKFAGNQGDLKIAFCNDPACSNPTIQTVDTPMEDTRATSIAVTSGDVPVISYSAPIGLKLAICNSATDCSSPTIRVLDPAGNPMGQTSSLVLNSSDVPIVSYTNGTTLQKVAFCQDAACSGVTTRTVETISFTDPSVRGNSVALNSAGAPVISYGYAGTLIEPPNPPSFVARLRVATCESATDCTAPTVNTLDGVGVTTGTLPGRDSSLALNSSGFPVVSYHEERFGDLKLAVCSDALCNNPASLTTLDATGNTGLYTSLELNSSDFPVISYFASTPDFDLKLATCNDATCSNPTLQTLDSAGTVGPFSSLALNSTDGPVISYYDATNGDLKLYTNTTGCNTNSWTANNEASLNSAIACYNQQTTAGTYTINVTQDIDLTSSTTIIDNASAGVELAVEGGSRTVDAQGVLDAWAFFVQADTKVTIREITVTGGNTTGPSNSGAVISVLKGTLTLIDSTLTGNQGSFGGALSNATGTVTIQNSTLSNNNASGGFLPLGGAIFNAGSDVGGTTTVGTVNVINSTISGNQTSGRGGGIYNSPDGVLNVTNSTISDNQATMGGGGIVNSTDSTIALNNAIVANSTGGDCVLDAGTINAQNSLIEDGLACVNGTSSNNLTGDPNLGVLQNNGGPTETHALLSGSIAINAGANALAVDPDGNPLTTDQRGPGFPRIIGGTVDIGAYESESQPVTLTIVKNAVGGDDTFEIGSTLDSEVLVPLFSLTTQGGTAQQTFSGLAAGFYELGENAPAGWELTDAKCVGTAGGSVFVLPERLLRFQAAPGDDVTCTFTNSKLSTTATLTVVKNTVGADGTFKFRSKSLTPDVFSLTTVSGTAARSFADLAPGNYDVTETVPVGWELTSAACDNGNAPGNITLAAGDNVTCTFTNTAITGRIVIVKRTYPVNTTQQFTFDPSWSDENFTLVHGGAYKSELAPGVYSVTEIPTPGWTLKDVSCSDGSPADAIQLEAGEVVRCKFLNVPSTNLVSTTFLGSVDSVTTDGGAPLAGATVEVYGPNSATKLAGRGVTDENGDYAIEYKYSGKGATFVVKLANSDQGQTLKKFKANDLAVVHFRAARP